MPWARWSRSSRCALAAALTGLALARSGGPTVAAVLVFGIGYGVLFPATAGYIAASIDPASRGKAFGLYNVFFSLGLAVGPAVGAAIAPRAIPLLGAAVVCAVGWVVVWVRGGGGLPSMRSTSPAP